MTKCEVCDFSHPDQCGVDMFSFDVIDLDKIRELDGTCDEAFVFLQKDEHDHGTVWLEYIHPDSEEYEMEWDDVCICNHCPKCGRKLSDEKERA